jgi:hypothetical protein
MYKTTYSLLTALFVLYASSTETESQYHNLCMTCHAKGYYYCSSSDMCFSTVDEEDLLSVCSDGTLINSLYQPKECGYDYRCENITITENHSPVMGGGKDWTSYTFDQYQGCVMTVKNYMPYNK